MWFLFITSKKRWNFNGKFPDSPVVILFWHGELLLAPFIYAKLDTSRKLNVMISDHFDGEIIARVTKLMGIKTIRGSSRKGAVKALISAIKSVKEFGEHVAITPDGPKGPRHSVSDGAVVIAQKAKIPIVIVNCHPEKYWQASSWDKFTVPKPFGTIDFYISEPIYINDMTKDEAKLYLKERMLKYAV
ncbi:lysophospholipid acyltransferase family protein [Hydrogenimonas thermophila]|nr:lysophospholipid acyltransferase family protein [Hydrogenimonas thermophila]WOE69648.1 lysophospholipid acyltransferase family protein [Hydrogenimonas thermophila]WOE72162.1 lysophospholipid acyltransferase family protein [Hydrogenimonas thermophila]